ncbi:hypothetical protein RUM44_012563 [Polyplax serrata]|uniref:Uncharacterized protein n=1 Tax=Polyplax serrata TaxID=468196 RepID=A0ABR1BG23_POLSC
MSQRPESLRCENTGLVFVTSWNSPDDHSLWEEPRSQICILIGKSFIGRTEDSETGDGEKDKSKAVETVRSVVGVPPITTPGHTGYLTFATFPPVWARKSAETHAGNDQPMETQ